MRWVVRCDARFHSTGERGDSNGEESKGRKEEGGQEEIRLRFNPNSQLPISKNSGSWELVPWQLVVLVWVHTITNPHVPNHIPLRQPIDDIHAVHNPAEHRVPRIEVRLR